MSSSDSLHESWFKQRAPVLADDDDLDDEDISAVVELEGSLGWALFLSAIGGAAGGAVMLLVARYVAARLHLSTDIVGTVGGFASSTFHVDAFRAGIGTGIVLGAVVGMLFGALMRYSLRMRARVLASVLLAPTLWTLAHAFLFKSFAPASLGALPFGPMIAGATAYGVLVNIVPPPRRRIVSAAE